MKRIKTFDLSEVDMTDKLIAPTTLHEFSGEEGSRCADVYAFTEILKAARHLWGSPNHCIVGTNITPSTPHLGGFWVEAKVFVSANDVSDAIGEINRVYLPLK